MSGSIGAPSTAPREGYGCRYCIGKHVVHIGGLRQSLGYARRE